MMISFVIIGVIWMSMIGAVLLSWKEEQKIKSLPRGIPTQYCQFCHKKARHAKWFGENWCCLLCWYELGLDRSTPRKSKRRRFRVAEITIEDIGDEI